MTYWYCRTCTAAGEGDRAAEQHVRDTAHTVETTARPKHAEERQSVRYWLTDKGWAAVGGRST